MKANRLSRFLLLAGQATGGFIRSLNKTVSTEAPMDSAAQDEWLVTHIPHRIRAALAGLPLQDELLKTLAAAEPHKIKERSAGNAAWEGRMAAVRWLIEFIGVKEDRKTGKPANVSPKGVDCSITMMKGGIPIDVHSPEAAVLARVWKGCSQASSHATHKSGHPPVGDPQLEEAMRIITAHLDRTIYAVHPRTVAAASLHLENR